MIRSLSAQALLLLLSILPLASGVRAGAWTQKRHDYFFKLSTNYFFTKKEFDHNGNRVAIFSERPGFENASFRDSNLNAYLEYGLTDRVTVIANLPVKALRSKWNKFIEFVDENGNPDKIVIPEAPRTSGFSDLTLASKYSVLTGALAVSLQGAIKLPLFYSKNPGNDGAPLGTGETDLEGRILIGKSLHPLPIYLTGGIGYRFRSGPLDDELNFDAEIGYTRGRFLFKLNFEATRSTLTPPDLFGATVVTPLPGGGGVVPSAIVGDQHITKISPSVIYSITNRASLQLEVLTTVAGTNTTSGAAFSLGAIFSR